MTNAINLLASLAQDVTRSVTELSETEQNSIADVKLRAAAMNPIMAIVEPSDPDEQPVPERTPEPQKNPKVA